MARSLVNRRTFIGAAFASLGLTGLYAEDPKPTPGSIPMRVFGKTGVKLTVIGQGGARLALLRDKERARAHVQHAVDLGINYFDCAHSYWGGHSEEVYGDVLPAVREQVFITTKTTERTRAGAEAELALSLKSLKTDHVDLWQMHGIEAQKDIDAVFAPGGALEAFEAARRSGKCRFIGFTGHFDPQALNGMLEAYDKWDSILMPLHAADPAYLSFEKQTLPHAVAYGCGIQAMKVFGNAFLLRVMNAEECLRYVLSLPVHCAALGCSTSGQLDDDVRFAQRFVPYTADEMDAVRKVAATAGPGGLKGPALEYWKKETE